MKRRPFLSSLAGRIVTLFLGLLLVIQAVGFLSIRESIDRNARVMLKDQLRTAERVLARLLDQKADGLRQGAVLLAADFGFRAAVQSGDAETVRSALQNQAGRIGAEVAAMLDAQGRLQAMSVDDEAALVPALAALAGQLGQPDAERSPLRLVKGQAMQFVVVPMKAPLLIGWVVMGFTLEPSLARDLQALSGVQMALVTQAPAQPAQLVLSTLADGAVMGLLGARPGLSEAPLGRTQIELNRVSLSRNNAGEISVLLYRSIDEAVAPYRSLQAWLAVITVLGLAAFGLGSWFTARGVTQPVRQLLRASQRLSEGDFSTPVPQNGRADELGELAQAFDGMREGLAARTEEIRQLAYWDRLTGLPNRTQFESQLSRALAAGGPVAVLLLNLDRLEKVNQALGRSFGDRLLQTAAERLNAVLRRLAELPAATDQETATGRRRRRIEPMVARLAGDEFALMLPGTSLDRAQWVVQDIARSFERPVSLDHSVVDLSAGIGLACAPEHGVQADLLMGRALLAVTEAKRQMAGSVVYQPSMDAGSAQNLSLLGELRHALRAGELRLYLQPKLRLSDGSLIGAEALVRWQHPLRGLVPPGLFIPFAEETGFVHELTLWVVEEAARVWAQQQALGLTLRLSVNLSAHDLVKPDLVGLIDSRLARHGAPPSAVCLEITESAIASDPQRALQTLHALKSRGYKLSIDDFGAGYTSLGQLTDLPVDELKIDMLFVRTMDRDENKAAMVRFIVGLAHDFKLSVVAEGVENAGILQRLEGIGCDEAQGYHISKPLPSDELLPWAQARWPGCWEADAVAALSPHRPGAMEAAGH